MKIYDKIIEIGLIFLIVFTPLAFGSVHVWAYTLMELTVLFLITLWLLKMIHQGEVRIPKTPLNISLLIFFLLLLFQLIPLPDGVLKLISPSAFQIHSETINSINPTDNTINYMNVLSLSPYLSKIALLKISTYIGVFFLVSNLKQEKSINRLILAIIAVGSFEAIYGLLEFLSGHQYIFWFKKIHYTTVPTGTYINRNHFAGYLEMVIPLTLGMLIIQLQRGQSNLIVSGNPINWRNKFRQLTAQWNNMATLLLFTAIIMSVALIMSLSRMAVFSLTASILLFGFLLIIQRNRKKSMWIVVIIFFGGIILYGTWLGMDPIFKRFSAIQTDIVSESGRPALWKDTANLIKDYPILGTGIGTYVQTFPKYKTIKADVIYDHAHNDYLELISETGFVGFLIIITGIGAFFIMAIKGLTKKSNIHSYGITLGGFVATFAIALHSFTDFNLHIPANALLLSIVLGLTTAVQNSKISQLTMQIN